LSRGNFATRNGRRDSQEGRRREWSPPTIVAGWIEESELPEGIMLRHWRNNWKI